MAPSSNDEDSLFDFLVKEGNGVKGLVDSGITKVPELYIQPPDERIDEQHVSCSHEVATIDFSEFHGPNHDQMVEAMAKAAETIGFFQVVNHGVSEKLMESLKDAGHRFFGQPLEKKAVYLKTVSPSPVVHYGTSYIPKKGEAALEWKDYITMIYTNDADALEFWPNECKEVALEFVKTTANMVKTLSEILLGKLGVTLDDSRMNALIGSRICKMNFYPPCPNPELTIGLGRHSDIGMLTVLLQDDIGGLYVKGDGTVDAGAKEEWILIPPIPGALVINIGDTLQILSDGKYKSSEHKVRAASTQSRVSVPIFNNPLPMEKIGPLPQLVERDGVARYREVIFGEYMKNKFGNVLRGKQSLDFAQPNSV